jgi:carnosine N-methyltransferase
MCYLPIIQEVQANFPEPQSSEGRISVLCPGTGLGRLPYELAKLGYRAQGNEFSYFMLLTSEFILNSSVQTGQFKIKPYIHDFTNIFQFEDVFREVTVPDVCPAQDLPEASEMSMAAGEFIEVYSEQPAAWDCVATCFFMDTASNILAYIQTIYETLKPGGVWINFGPLLYHFAEIECETSIDLSWEEFRHAVLEFGFEIKKESKQEAVYAGEVNTMLEVRYKCVFFTAVKPKRV